jgi:hypothetical protein
VPPFCCQHGAHLTASILYELSEGSPQLGREIPVAAYPRPRPVKPEVANKASECLRASVRFRQTIIPTLLHPPRTHSSRSRRSGRKDLVTAAQPGAIPLLVQESSVRFRDGCAGLS